MIVAIASVAPVQLRNLLTSRYLTPLGRQHPASLAPRRGRGKAGSPRTRLMAMADTSTTVQKVSAEALGTFVLVFFGCGSVVFSSNILGGVDYTAVGLTFGLAVMLMIYAVGRVSGGHFNPAVSVSAAVGGRIPWKQVPIYVGAQLGGAILAGLVLFVLAHGIDGFDSHGNMGQNFFGDQSPNSVHYAWWAAFLVELLLTMLFVMVILAVTDARFEHP